MRRLLLLPLLSGSLAVASAAPVIYKMSGAAR